VNRLFRHHLLDLSEVADYIKLRAMPGASAAPITSSVLPAASASSPCAHLSPEEMHKESGVGAGVGLPLMGQEAEGEEREDDGLHSSSSSSGTPVAEWSSYGGGSWDAAAARWGLRPGEVAQCGGEEMLDDILGSLPSRLTVVAATLTW
jgi:hypothetical protein